MQLSLYKKVFSEYFNSKEVEPAIAEAVKLVKSSKRIFFIGNGGSNAISSHMMEDYAKIAGYPTFSFSDAALITCYANDYGYENAIKEWLRIHFVKGDLLVAISSSGNSPNIINAVDEAISRGGSVISLSAFKADNKLAQRGNVRFHIPVDNFGMAECFHQVILHIILDSLK